MRSPKPEEYEPEQSRFKLEEVDISGVTPIQARKKATPPVASAQRDGDTVIPRHHDTTVDTTTPRYRDTIKAVRSAVKRVGKEAATHRFTVEEKQAVNEIIFAYSQKKIRTSENEIARIALNYLVEDYRQYGDGSVLARVLRELND
jgi:hypothetical protein